MVALAVIAVVATPFTVAVDPSVAAKDPQVKAIITAAASKTMARLPHRGRVTITVGSNLRLVIPEVAVGGYTDAHGDVRINVDLSQLPTAHVFLPATVAHELHHSSRIRTGPGYGTTLGGAMVSEGLADHFALELYPHTPLIPWDHALQPREERTMWTKAKSELASTNYDQNAWFFGIGPFPRWTGYTLGWHIVGRYLAQHHTTAQASVKTPASKILAGFSP